MMTLELRIEELEPRLTTISEVGLNAIAEHRPFNAPPQDPPPDFAQN
jgi:hypothetical protein